MPLQRQRQKADRWSLPLRVIPQARVRRAPSNHQSVLGQEAGEGRAGRNGNDRDKEAQGVALRRPRRGRTDVDRPEGPDARATVAHE